MRNIKVEPLKGLPPYGEPAIGFDRNGRKNLHSEGFVIEFSSDKYKWVGNFAYGLSRFNFAALHPDAVNAFIIAGGHAYIVDPSSKTLKESFGGAIVDAFPHPKEPWIILNHQNIAFEAIGQTGSVWKSQRISWDGFKLVPLEGKILTGEAWDAVNQNWAPFRLDLNTGLHEGGTYHPETFIPITDDRTKSVVDMIYKLKSSKTKE